MPTHNKTKKKKKSSPKTALLGITKPSGNKATGTAVTLPVTLALSAIQDKKARSRHLRSAKTPRGKKLAGKIAVWDRTTLDTLKGVAAAKPIPDRQNLQMKGNEANPGKSIKSHLSKAYQSLQKKTLTTHVAGAPAYICKLAEDAGAAKQIDYVFYAVDQTTGRSEVSVGRIEGKHVGRGKGSLPKMLGDAKSSDHAGHGIPEGGVHDPDLVNHLVNLVPQDGTVNVSHKKIFENQVISYAENNPGAQVHTIHERFYSGDSLRPLAETHYFVVDGVIASSITLENP